MRWQALGLLILLGGCSGDRVQLVAEGLSPGLAAQHRYDRSVTNYMACISSKPPAACAGLKAVMNANAAVLAKPETNITILR